MSPASAPRPEDLQQRYAALEQVYAQQRWPEVETRCQELLAELPDDPGDPLRLRLLLLLAHTRLYGSGDPAAAASLYAAVLAAAPEAVLAQMAEQGLAQCGQLGDNQNSPAGEEEGATTGTPAAEAETTADATTTANLTALAQAAVAAVERSAVDAAVDTAAADATETPAMPWLQELAGEPARRSLQVPVESSLALAPFQRPAPASQTPNVSSTQDVPTPERTASAADTFKPLRWPFMADYVERPLVDPATPATMQRTAAGAAQETGATADAETDSERESGPDSASTAASDEVIHAHAGEPDRSERKPGPEAELDIEELTTGRFSLEEIQALSKGLLLVTLPADPAPPPGQASQA